MRLLHLNGHLDEKGGIEVYLRALITRLSNLRFDVTMGHAAPGKHPLIASHQMTALDSPSKGDAAKGYDLINTLIHEKRIQVAHVHNIHNTGAIAACIENVPTILHLHDYRYMCPVSTFYQRRTATRCQRTCGPVCFAIGPVAGCQTPRLRAGLGFYRRVKFAQKNAGRFYTIVSNSQFVAQRFRDGCDTDAKIEVLHYPIESANDQRPGSTVSLPPTALFVGRVRRDKGIFDFIKAIGRTTGVQGRILGCGDDASKQAVLKIAGQVGCSERLSVEGWKNREQIAEAMVEATVVVFPSLWDEPFGLVGPEAMACGTSVVAYDVGGVSDWINDGENGFLVPPGDIALLAKRIQEICQNQRLAETFGARGREFVSSNFSVEQHMGRLLEIYRAAVA